VRRVSIVVTCDACGEGIQEETEGASTHTITGPDGATYELELCGECRWGTFLQEARPVTNRKKRKAKGEFMCDLCPKTFATERGRNAHQTRMHE
jgi:hypothetical protein